VIKFVNNKFLLSLPILSFFFDSGILFKYLCYCYEMCIIKLLMLIGAIYICTENAFPSKRLQQLLENSEIAKTHSVNGDVIFVIHIATTVIKIYYQ